MKKSVLCIIFLILFIPYSDALEEFTPDNNGVIELSAEEFPCDLKSLTFSEKIQKIKSAEITDTNETSYLFKDILTKEFEKGAIETMEFFGYYRGYLNTNFDDGFDGEYNFSSIQTGIKGRFRGGENLYQLRLRLNPIEGYSFLQTLPLDIYVENRSIPHHSIIIGNSRTPVGYEGSMSNTLIPFALRAQISRNFGNTRKLGVRIKGNYDLIDYDLGGFSSESYFKSFFPGTEFSGKLNFKPLGKTDGKFGNLLLGGSMSAGKYNDNYFVGGLHAVYEYKKFFADFEWASADGYNGYNGLSDKKAEGFYATAGYKITPKLQIAGRYDEYTPNKDFSENKKREYSAGLNYFIKGQALKLILNYVFCQNDLGRDSHRIIFGTQIML